MNYPGYEFLIELHVFLMRDTWQETHYGPTHPELLKSALARPMQAAYYEGADGVRQAAYLFHGLLMNHGFAQGNKRTAYAATRWFLWENRLGTLTASLPEIVSFCYAAENEKWLVDQVESWLRTNLRIEVPG
jgi:death-on-curing protein